MSVRGKTARTLLAVLAVSGAVALSSESSAAVDLTSLYSENVAKAVFARHYGTVWDYLDPRYRSVVSRSRWQRCVARLVKQSSSYRIKSIRVAGTRALPSRLPLLGKVRLVDVDLQLLYTLPGSRTLLAGILYAYWVKSKGHWVAVWLPSQYAAYKAGKCSSSSLY